MKPFKCAGCWLEYRGFGFAQPQGWGRANISVVLSDTDAADLRKGKTLTKYSAGGSIWNKMISKYGYAFDDFTYETVLRCAPTVEIAQNSTLRRDCCDRHGYPGATELNKKLYIASGRGAAELLIRKTMVDKESMDFYHGFIFDMGNYFVMPVHDFTLVKEGQFQLSFVLQRDIEKALKFARGQWNPFAEYALKKYKTNGTAQDLEYLCRAVYDNPEIVTMYDTEGDEITDARFDEEEKPEDYTISTVQFSIKRHEAFEFNVLNSSELWDGVKELFRFKNIKCGHNVYNHDNKVLTAQGVEINGLVYDSMWMFKHRYAVGGSASKTSERHVPKHLQTCASMAAFPFPWKHRVGELDGPYPCTDADALNYVYYFLKYHMDRIGLPGGWSLYKGFTEHVVMIQPALKKAQRERGIPVDRERHRKFGARLLTISKRRHEAVQELVPPELRKYKTWKNGPKPIIQMRKELKARGYTDKSVQHRILVHNAHKFGIAFDEASGLWYQRQEFKLSAQNLKAYCSFRQQQEPTIAGTAKWNLPLHHKTKEPTTAKDAIPKVAKRTGDPLLSMVVRSREIDSMLSNMWKGWTPKRDGCVHAEWYFGPPSGQLASKKPNVQNLSKHQQLGQMIRWLVRAQAGRFFSEMDFKSFHVAMMGFLAFCKQYYRLSQSDMHAIVTTYFLGDNPIPFDWPLEAITAECARRMLDKDFKAIRSYGMKRAVLGNQLGLGAKRLWLMNEPHIKSKEHAQSMQDLLARLFPEVEVAKKKFRAMAHENNYLLNMFGRIQLFYQVFQVAWVNGQIARKFGKEHDAAGAFPVQSNAFGHVFEKIRQLDDAGLCDAVAFINTVHDSVQFHPMRELSESQLWDVKLIMEGPSTVLKNEIAPDGFRVGVDVAVGTNLRDYNAVTNPYGMKKWKLGDGFAHLPWDSNMPVKNELWVPPTLTEGEMNDDIPF